MRYVLTILLGAALGGAAVYFLFVGTPRAANKLPGEPVRAPEPGGPPPGTAVVELDEQFFNELLGTVFTELGQPTFRLGSAGPRPGDDEKGAGFRYVEAQAGGGGGCPNQVVIAPEGGGVRTGVRLAGGQLLAPLAFSGTYSLFGQCMNFRGTAEANVALRFDAPQQSLYGELNVAGVTLEGMSPVFSGPVTLFVQNAINQRVNPLTIMRGEQISLTVPVQATGGTLRAQAKDIRADIQDGRLRLHITYDFNGSKGAPASPPG
ncbi:MAG TPA: hypothetical protein VD968_09190 [Pyrinomonadaceae bacterium]|nr:hypothetical protein [Pyrinomonadaceae bacterium]